VDSEIDLEQSTVVRNKNAPVHESVNPVDNDNINDESDNVSLKTTANEIEKEGITQPKGKTLHKKQHVKS
jgi:hypothetical protein